MLLSRRGPRLPVPWRPQTRPGARGWRRALQGGWRANASESTRGLKARTTRDDASRNNVKCVVGLRAPPAAPGALTPPSLRALRVPREKWGTEANLPVFSNELERSPEYALARLKDTTQRSQQRRRRRCRGTVHDELVSRAVWLCRRAVIRGAIRIRPAGAPLLSGARAAGLGCREIGSIQDVGGHDCCLANGNAGSRGRPRPRTSAYSNRPREDQSCLTSARPARHAWAPCIAQPAAGPGAASLLQLGIMKGERIR